MNDQTRQAEKRMLQTDFIRRCSSFLNVIQELEGEINNLKIKKLPESLIAKKDLQVENLVNFYNDADELLNYYKRELTQARLENYFLTEMMVKKMNIEDVIKYHPQGSKVFLINNDTAEHVTISSIG